MSISYIIVLGSGLIEDKVPPLLQSRIDIGKNFWDSKKDKHTKFLLAVDKVKMKEFQNRKQ